MAETTERNTQVGMFCRFLEDYTNGTTDGINAEGLENYIRLCMWDAYKASNTLFEDKEALREEFDKWYAKNESNE